MRYRFSIAVPGESPVVALPPQPINSVQILTAFYRIINTIFVFLLLKINNVYILCKYYKKKKKITISKYMNKNKILTRGRREGKPSSDGGGDSFENTYLALDYTGCLQYKSKNYRVHKFSFKITGRPSINKPLIEFSYDGFGP